MASTATYSCRRCGKSFTARVADRNRGWALFCSKSCKASEQEGRTHQHRNFRERKLAAVSDGDDGFQGGWDEHKDWI